jgi:adenylate cyclase class IV
MPSSDFTRKSIERTNKTILKLQERFLQYTGPRMVVESHKEERLRIQNQDPEDTMAMIKHMGPEQWDTYMKEIYK